MSINVNATQPAAWAHHIANSRGLLARCISGAGTDHQEWLVESSSEPGVWHRVTLEAASWGVSVWCRCGAGMHGSKCRHAAKVLIETGHLCRYQRVVASRTRRWTHSGVVVEGQIKLVGFDGDWQWLSQFDPADWGAASVGFDRQHTAQRLLVELHQSPQLNSRLCEWLQEQQWAGWEVTTGELLRLLAGEAPDGATAALVGSVA